MADDRDLEEAGAVVIHESLNRPILLMGGERELVLLLALICGIFALALHHVWSIAAAVVLWATGSWALARAGAYDPQLSKTGARALRFQVFYPGQATLFARDRKVLE